MKGNRTIAHLLLACLLLPGIVTAAGRYADPDAAYRDARKAAVNGAYQQAIDIYTGLLQQHPDNPDYLLGAGQAYLWQGKPAAAIPLLVKGMALAPDYEDIYRALSQAYENNRQPQQAAALYKQAMARFKQPDWAVQGLKQHQKASRPVLSLKLSNRLETLSNNKNDWRDTEVKARLKFDDGRQFSISYVNSARFGLVDNTMAAETYLPVGEHNTVYGELRYSNSHHVLPEYSVHLQLTHSFSNGLGLIGGYKRINYTESGVHVIDLGAEYYFSNYRAAYTAYISNSDTAGGALSHQFQLGYTFPSMSNIQLAVATGSEVEKTVNASSITRTDFTTITFWGETILTPNWSFIYAAGYTALKVNNFISSDRRFFELGLRYTF